MRWMNLLLAHGTVERMEDMGEFLTAIRRGRPPSEELLTEMVDRYEAIGGSPLLTHTQAQAVALEQRCGVPTRVAMRLWRPRIAELADSLHETDGVVLIPLAPFSIDVYAQAARRELSELGYLGEIRVVEPWGAEPALVGAFALGIESTMDGVPDEGTWLILSAHSLPMRAIQEGDDYAQRFETSARLVAEELARHGRQPTVLSCFQSQGASGGEWLGPSLEDRVAQAHQAGAARVVVAPIGFFAEHVETLYDLDVEGAALAARLGLAYLRVPTLMTAPGLIETLATVSERARR